MPRETEGFRPAELQMSIHRLLEKSGFRTFTLLTAAAGCQSVSAAPGDRDTTFGPLSPYGSYDQVMVYPADSATITTAVPQADGTILIGGAFTLVNGTVPATNSRTGLAKLTSAGLLDANYRPIPNGDIRSFNVRSDGNHFVTGAFTTLRKNSTSLVASRTSVGLLGPAGDIDGDFVPSAATGAVNTIVEQGAGGNFIIGTTTRDGVAGASGGLFRLRRNNGTYDTTFNNYPMGPVVNVQVQPNLKILMAGGMAGVDPDPAYYDRRKANGSADKDEIQGNNGQTEIVDNFTNPSINGQIRAMALQKDGKILIAGDFLVVTVPLIPSGLQNINQSGIARLNPDGTFDATFRPVIGGASHKVHTLALQADGKILIGGEFTTISSTTGTTTTTLTRRGIARINNDGTVDSSFDAKFQDTSWFVHGISLLSDGKVLVTGLFRPPGISVTVPWRIALLHNDSYRSYIRTPSETQLQWIRTGSVAETSEVEFQYSFDGQFWISLGMGLRIGSTSNWSLSVPAGTLQNNYYIRAMARTSGGIYAASSGLTAASARYPIPELSVTNALGIPYVSGGTTSLGYTVNNVSTDFQFNVRNSGTGNLTGLTATLSGADAGEFSIVTAPTPPLAGPGGTTPLVIRYTPAYSGAKTVNLNITSNDPNTPAYATTLTLNVVTPIEAFRQLYFNTTANTGNAANDQDPDGDGQTNFFEFVAGLVPTNRNSRFVQQVDRSSGTPQVIFSPIVSGRTYEVQTSTSLLSGSWEPAAGTSADVGAERTFTHTGVTDPKRFYRVKITK